MKTSIELMYEAYNKLPEKERPHWDDWILAWEIAFQAGEYYALGKMYGYQK